MLIALTSQEMWMIGLIVSVIGGIISWLVGKLYSSNRTFLADQFKGMNDKHSEHGTKLDGISKTVNETKIDLERLDGAKISWEDFRDVKRNMEKDMNKDIKLAVSTHVEKHH